MSILNKLVNKHLSTYGESYGFQKPKKPLKTRKYNRKIAAECVSLASPSVRKARAENRRLRTKLKSSYLVASGEAKTVRAVAESLDKMMDDIGKGVSKVIEAIRKFFVQIWRWLTSNRDKWERVETQLKQHVSKLGAGQLNSPIEVPQPQDISSVAGRLTNELKALKNCLSNGTAPQGKYGDDFVKKNTANGNSSGKATETVTTRLNTGAAVKKYAQGLFSTADKLAKSEDDLRAAEEAFKKASSARDKKGDEKEEEIYQKVLNLCGKCLGEFQVAYGHLVKASGAIMSAKEKESKK